jgi:hypothetical protein
VVQQRGFAAAQKARKHGHGHAPLGYLGGLVASWLRQQTQSRPRWAASSCLAAGRRRHIWAGLQNGRALSCCRWGFRTCRRCGVPIWQACRKRRGKGRLARGGAALSGRGVREREEGRHAARACVGHSQGREAGGRVVGVENCVAAAGEEGLERAGLAHAHFERRILAVRLARWEKQGD